MTWTELQKLIHEEDRGRARDEVERVIAQREQYDIEYRVNRPDGSKVWVGVLGRAVYDFTWQGSRYARSCSRHLRSKTVTSVA